MDYFETNIKTLKERFPYIMQSIDTYERESDAGESQVSWDEDLDGTKIMAVEKDGYLWYLNSRYHSNQMVEAWCARHKRKNYFEPEIIFGMGTGDYLIRQRKENPHNPFLVYEPDLNVFLALLHGRDLTEVLEDEKLYLAVGKNGITESAVWMSNAINYSNYEYIDFCALPGYTSVYPYEYLLYKRAFLEMLESLVLRKNTLNHRGREIVDNVFSHVQDVVRQHTLVGLIDKFKEVKNEMPQTAFLISAGPSLDKNIQDLKAIQGRAFVMAVDTAMKPLLQAGIEPDMFVTIDPVKDIFLFEQEGIEKIPMILSSHARGTVSKMHTGLHFYIVNSGDYVIKYLDRYDKKYQAGSGGGSVATDAFLFLRQMGFSTIVLVGQDLAYPNNRSHAKAAYDEEINPETQEGVFFMVEDIYGGEVLTRMDMNHYRRWFEEEITKAKNLNVIDATEGGAKIRGTEIMTLKEAIERQCHETYDFGALIDSVPPTFTEDQQRAIREDVAKFPEHLRETEKKLKEGKSKYERLDKLNRQRKYQTSEFKRVYEQISQFNDWLNEDLIVDLFSSLSHREEFKVQYEAYHVKDDTYEDIKEIAKQGISLIDAYLEKIEILEKCAEHLKEE